MADDAFITPSIHEHPTVQTARLRAKCERAVEQLLAILDTLTPDADLEPELGAADCTGRHTSTFDQRHWADGQDAEPDDDLEPSLGGLNLTGIWHDQKDWARGGTSDVEDEHDGKEPDVDDEPSLGSLAAPQVIEVAERDPDTGRARSYRLSDPADQSRWGDSVGPADAEDQCEDEGGQCDDEGAVACDFVCEYADPIDQTSQPICVT